jgi:hypothetical protein
MDETQQKPEPESDDTSTDSGIDTGMDTGIYTNTFGEPVPTGDEVADLLENAVLNDAMQAAPLDVLRDLEPRIRELYERAADGKWPSSAAPLDAIKKDALLALALIGNSRTLLEMGYDATSMAWNFGFRFGRLYERLLVRRIENNARLGRDVRQQRRKGGASRRRLNAKLNQRAKELAAQFAGGKVSRTEVCRRVANALQAEGVDVSAKTISRILKADKDTA